MTHTPMIDTAVNVQRAQALRRHLSENESECIKRNIIVRVDSINADHSVALCSVEQRLLGFFRRTYPITELVWRAEQALAPLVGLGLVPLITVKHKSLMNTTSAGTIRTGRSPMDWVPAFWKWLGYPLSREGFGAVTLLHDPFGWRQAMTTSGSK